MEALKMNNYCTVSPHQYFRRQRLRKPRGAKFPEGEFPWSISTFPLSFPCFQIKCKSASEVAQNLNIWSNSHTGVFSTFPRSDSSMCSFSNSDMLYFANIFKDCPTKIYQQKCILGLSNNYVIVERGRVSSNNCIFTWGRSGGWGGLVAKWS